MKKTVVALLIAVLSLSSMLAGCGDKSADKKTEDEKMTISVAITRGDESWEKDDYYKYITDKVGVNIKFQSLSADAASEKARILIASGNMADITYCDFNFDEYMKYGQQGVVKALPDGWEEKYPNVGFSMAMTGLLDHLKEAGNGKIYGFVRPMDSYIDYLDDFRAAYKEGKNLKEMMAQPQYRFIDKYGFAYRKDWAEQLGIKTDTIMKYDDFMDMVLKFKEADLGGVGADNTVGIACDYTEAPNIFITAFNSSYKYFHKDESGKYVCGLLEDTTTEGVKAYAEAYRKGILSPGFYTQKAQNLNSIFCSQRSGILFPRGNASDMKVLVPEFEKANPGLEAEKCIDICWLLSPDGTVHGRESGNYWGGYYLNPKMSDEKLNKILELADYVSSVEGGPQVKLGVPDKDFKIENGEYIVTREKNENGVRTEVSKLYPSYEFFAYFLSPQYKVVDESNPFALDIQTKLLAAKRSQPLSLLDWDVARDCYGAEDYVKFNAANEVNSMFAEIIVGEGDPVQAWEKKREEIKEDAQKVAENMNKALLK